MTEAELDELRAKWFYSGWASAMKELKLRLDAGHSYEDLDEFLVHRMMVHFVGRLWNGR